MCRSVKKLRILVVFVLYHGLDILETANDCVSTVATDSGFSNGGGVIVRPIKKGNIPGYFRNFFPKEIPMNVKVNWPRRSCASFPLHLPN